MTLIQVFRKIPLRALVRAYKTIVKSWVCHRNILQKLLRPFGYDVVFAHDHHDFHMPPRDLCLKDDSLSLLNSSGDRWLETRVTMTVSPSLWLMYTQHHTDLSARETETRLTSSYMHECTCVRTPHNILCEFLQENTVAISKTKVCVYVYLYVRVCMLVYAHRYMYMHVCRMSGFICIMM